MSASVNLVQHVVVRSDLIKSHKWNLGSLVAQGCHACSAALHKYKDNEDTISYLTDLDHMRKVILGVS
jgi:peptidyl-tRNA hydrolase